MNDTPVAGQPRQQLVVVGIDGSPGARIAFDWAVAEAEVRGAHLEVVTAWDVPYRWAEGYNDKWYEDRETLTEQARTDATATAEEWLGRGGLPDWLRIQAMEGPAARALLTCAKEADLLVVGSRGRGGFGALLLGSVSTACVHHAPCPVVVVPGPRPDAAATS